MKKRVKSLLLGVAAVVGFGSFATACVDLTASTDEHKHTYSDAWKADAEGHWHELTCEDCTEAPVKEEHVDNNNDAACDICTYTDHEHTYSEEWTVDCTNHWHAADCGHIVAGDGIAAHVDENEDGECDDCFYIINDIHEHYYSNEWTSDAEYHWNAALCEHKDQIANKAPHTLNAAGDCTDCGAHINDVDESNIEAVLAAAVANNYKIAYGDVIEIQKVYGGTGMETLESGGTHKVHFALGNGESYIQYASFDMNDQFIGQNEQWFETTDEIDEDGNPVIFGAELEYGQHELKPIAGAAQFLNGYNYIPGSVLPSASDDTSTLANTLSALYAQMKAGERVSNVVEDFDEETGRYEFAYTYYSVNAKKQSEAGDNPGAWMVELELYNVAVTFSINDEMIIDQADFYVEVYRDYENDSDLEYTFNEETEDVEDLKLKDTANPSLYVYSVAQTAGERTFTSPYPRESLIPTSFEFSYVTEYDFPDAFDFQLISEEPIGDSLTLQEGTYAYFHLGDILPKTASTKFLNSSDFTYSFVNKDPNSTASAWYSSDSILNGYSAYISCLKLKLRDPGEYTVTITFGNLTKTFDLIIEGKQAPELGEDDANNVYVATTDTYAWGVDLYTYTAEVSGTYTFTIPANLGFQTKESYDANGNPQVDFYSNASGSTVTLDIAAGRTLEFYVAATTTGAWHITVSCVEGDVGEGDVGNEGGNQGGDEGGETSGAISFEKIAGTYTYNGSNVLTINADGTMTFAEGAYNHTITMTLDGNTISYSLNGGTAYIPPTGMSSYFGYLIFDENGMPVSFVRNQTTYALTAGSGEGGGEGTEPTEPEAVTDVTIEEGANDLTIAENTYIEATVYLMGEFTLTWDNANVTVEVNGSEIASGDTVAFNPMGATLKIYSADYAAAELTLTITAASGGDVGGETEGDGSESNPFVVEELPANLTVNYQGNGSVGMVWYAFTLTEDGKLTITFDGTDNWFYVNQGTNQIFQGGSAALLSYSVDLTAGDYVVGIATWSENAATLEVSLTFTAGEAGGEDPVEPNPGETEEPVGYLYDGSVNEITVTADDKSKGYVLYAFNVWTTGDYAFTSGDLGILSITDSEGNEVESVDWGTYTLTEGFSYLVKINTAWVSNAGTYEMNIEYQYPLGAQENPITLWDAGEYTASYAGNYAPAVWYTYTVYEDGVLTVSTNSETATVMLGIQGASYPNESVGAVTLNALAGMTYVIGVAEFDATEAVEIAFTVAVTAGTYEGDGTANMPAMIGLGDIEVNAPESDTAYYAYKATAAGLLTLTVNYENADWNVKVVGEEGAKYPEEGVIAVDMYEGQVIIISVSTWDFSAATYTINATWKAAPTGVFEGISIALGSNNLTIAENTYIQVDAQGFDTGDYTVTWSNENVIVKVDGMEFTSGDTFYSYNARYPVTFMVCGVNYVAVEVTLTIEKVVIPATPVVVGDNTVTVTDTWNGTAVEFTATEAGKYVFTAGTNAVLIYDYSNYLAGEFFEVEATEGQVIAFVVLTEDNFAGDVVVTIAKAGEVVEPEVPAEPDGTEGNPYIVTELPYEITLTDKLDVYVQYTATEDCTLVITRTGGNVNGLPGNFENDLTAKTHTGTVTAGQVLLINFYAYSSKTYTISVAAPVEPEQPGTEEPEVPSGDYPTNHTGSGTKNDRYVILSLPYGITFEGVHDAYMTYTATEDCTLYITCPAGCYVSELKDSPQKDANGNYTVTLKAGDVLNLNPWKMSGTDSYTYTITKLEVEEPEEPEEPEQGGGEETGNVVTYLSAKHSNGRVMKVEVNVEAGTLTVTRSDMTGNFTGGATAHETTFTPGGELPTSFSGVMLTWNADGSPATVTWSGAVYDGFAAQA